MRLKYQHVPFPIYGPYKLQILYQQSLYIANSLLSPYCPHYDNYNFVRGIKTCQYTPIMLVCAYNANILPILYPLEFASIYSKTWQNMASRIQQNIVSRIWQNIMASRIRQNIAKYGKAISIKEELLVSAAATNLITIATDMPCDLISLMPICMRINPIIRHCADMPII